MAAPSTATRRSGDSRAARKELDRIERRLERLTREESAIHTRMAAVASDHEKVIALDEQLRALSRERDELEEQWLELADDT
jgi:ATP-binding cassette subfamily F protein uup